MPIKLADTLAPMGNFPAVESDNVDITIEGSPKSLQQAYEDGDLGGGGSDIEVTSMPDASASYLDKVLLYVGDTGTYEYGKFYKCVSDGETPPSYSWEDAGIGSDPVDGTTIVKDSSTGELSAVQATQSTKGIVKGGNGTQIGSNGEVNVVNRLEEINALPTATADNLDKCYLLKGTQTGYQTGAIYQCRLIAGSDPAEYEWVLLSANPLTFDSDDFNVANDNVELQPSRRVYGGTRAAWNLLSVAEKTKYGATAFTDDEGGEYIDVYSTEEVKTNKVWIDEKPIYRKVVYFGDLPNNTSKSIAHGISNLGYIIHWYGFCKGKTNELQRPVPFPGISSTNDQAVRLYSNNTTLSIACVGDNSAYGNCYVTIEYTKTTD